MHTLSHVLVVTGWIVGSIVVYFVLGTFLIHLLDKWKDVESKDAQPTSTKEGAALSAIWPLILILFIVVGAWEGLVWLASRGYEHLTKLYSIVLP